LLYKRSLAIWEKTLGPEHPNVALSLNSLAELYRTQGRYSDALPIVQRTISQNTARKPVAFSVLYGSRSKNLISPKQALDASYAVLQRSDWKAHGVVNKSIRPFGMMSSLVLARALGSYHARLEAKINKLEETLRARRDVEKAIRILMEFKSIEEGEAYRLLRDQAQAKRLPIGQIAANIVSLHETLGGLGLEVRGPTGTGSPTSS
jgi:hypothetical protein